MVGSSVQYALSDRRPARAPAIRLSQVFKRCGISARIFSERDAMWLSQDFEGPAVSNLLRVAFICAKRAVDCGVILGFLLCSQGFHTAPAVAASPNWCAWPSTIQILPGMVDANTSNVMMQDAIGIRTSHNALNRWAKRFVTCKPGADREAAAGYLNSWQGILLHGAADDRWREKINLANQQLASCVVNFHGTDRGAQCETRLQTNVRLKTTWEMSAAQPDQ